MNCESYSKLLFDSLAGELSDDEQSKLDNHIQGCSACRAELDQVRQTWQKLGSVTVPEPSQQMHTHFYAMLESFVDVKSKKSRSLSEQITGWFEKWQFSIIPSRIAFATFFLVFGIGIGFWITSENQGNNSSQQIEDLSNQVQEVRQLMVLSMLENPSASERLQAVSFSSEIVNADAKIIDALLTTLNYDSNVNVRLVTVDALAKFADDPRVREGLIQSLSRQDSPLVQMALADLMVALQEKRSIKHLKSLLQQKGVHKVLKTKIERSIKLLS